MRFRPVQLVLLAVVVGACSAPQHRTEQAAVAGPATKAAAQASTVQKRQAKPAPPGMLLAAQRRPAPSLRVTTFDARMVTLDDFRGRPLVVSFFESWCQVCQVEQPDLSRVAAEFSPQVGFVGVSYHDTVAAGRAYQRRFNVPYPLANDSSGQTWARWEVPYQPVTVLVDKQGRVAVRYDGGTTGGTLRAALAYLVGE
jgi:peroxiredoxin